MKLKSLDIRGVRNLESVSLIDLSTVNIFYGENGAGKSSILEALHILGLARSFRSTQLKPVIHYTSSECTVYGKIEVKANRESSLGIRRMRKGGFRIKVDGQEKRSVVSLAELLPLQIINATSYLLLESGPKLRRQFLDWGVFHVEHEFLDVWRRAQRCIKQRNAYLRNHSAGKGNTVVWDRELVVTGERLDAMRCSYFKQMLPVFVEFVERLVELENVSIDYRRGWSLDKPLGEVLHESMDKDASRGITHYGPHRADVRVTVNGIDAAQVLSRGQLKLVVCAMRLAQLKLFQSVSQEKGVLLIDDLPAEIDVEHQAKLCSLMDGLNTQLFITCIEPENVTTFDWHKPENVRLFHVKQGSVSAIATSDAELPD